MPETWYARDGTGEACGPGTRRNLSQTQGASAVTQDIASEHTWNKPESRTIEAGTWTVNFDVDVAGGGGPPARVICRVRRMNSSCQQQALLHEEETGNLNDGAVNSISQTFSPGEIAFQAGDLLLVQFLQTNGNRATLIRYNGTGDSDTHLIHPDELSQEQHSGGSSSSVPITTTGSGSKAGLGAASSSVPVASAGAGEKQALGGAASSVPIAAAGAGTKAAFGGASSSVPITTTGGGQSSEQESHAGGSVSAVPIAAQGAGSKGVVAGAVSAVAVAAAGAGLKQGFGGAVAAIPLMSTGAGSKHAYGGKASVVPITATGGGTGPNGSSEVLWPWALIKFKVGPGRFFRR